MAKKQKSAPTDPAVIAVPRTPSGTHCCNCGCSVGDSHKTQAFFVDDDGEPRTWCPSCFFNVRSPKEPGRWNGVATECRSCGWKAFQHNFNPRELLHCPRCGSTQCRVPVAPAVAKELIAGR